MSAALHVPCAVDILDWFKRIYLLALCKVVAEALFLCFYLLLEYALIKDIMCYTARLCSALASIEYIKPWLSSNAGWLLYHCADHAPANDIFTVGQCCLLSAHSQEPAISELACTRAHLLQCVFIDWQG